MFAQLFTLFPYIYLIGFAFLLVKSYQRRRKEKEIDLILDKGDVAKYEAVLDLETEKTLRERWKITLFVQSIIFFITALIMIPDIYNQIPNNDLLSIDTVRATLILYFSLFFILWIGSLYYCVYKKHGTAMLFLILILSVWAFTFSLIPNIIEVFNKFTDHSLNYSIGFLMIMLVNKALNICFIINSFYLYKMNKMRKEARLSTFTAKKQMMATE